MNKIKLLSVSIIIFVVLLWTLSTTIAWSAIPTEASRGSAASDMPMHLAPATAAIMITKGPNLQQVRAGQQVTFSIALTNTGDVTLGNVEVNDPLVPDCDRMIGQLEPEAQVSYECTTIVNDDLTNTATVTAEGDQGGIVEASDSATVDVTPSTFIYDDVPELPIPIKLSTECFSSGMITRTFEVNDNFTVGDVNFGLNADHEFRSHIWAFLTSPAGTTVEMTTDCWTCDSRHNFDVLIDDASPNDLDDGDDDDTGEPYYDREAHPHRPLSALIGEPSQGVWTLEICDKYTPEHHGTYNRSRLILQDATILADKKVDRVILEPDASMIYSVTFTNHTRVLLEDVTLEDITPADSSFVPGSLNVSSGVAEEVDGVITWHGDMAVDETVMLNFASNVVTTSASLITNTALISHPILANPLHPTVVGQVFTDAVHLYSNEEDIAITDGFTDCIQPITSEITVADNFYIGDVEVGATAEHTMRADLIIHLFAPWGQMVRLDSAQGGSDENLDARFSDAGSKDVLISGVHDVGAPYYEVLARPPGGDEHKGPLAVYDAQLSPGIWKLEICDDFRYDTGSLRQWSLFLEEANVWLGYDESWHTASNWSKGSVPNSRDFVLILPTPEGGHFPVLDGDATVENLMLKENTQLDLRDYAFYVEDYMESSGLISQTVAATEVNAPVEFLRITNSAGDKDMYHGLVITPTVSSLGQVTVGIRSNQSQGCTDVGSDALLSRCWHIQAEHPATSTVQFYFSEQDRNKQDASNLTLWKRGHPAYQWRQVGENFVHSESNGGCASESGYACWLQAENVNWFGRLTAGTYSPPDTAIGVQDGNVRLSWSQPESGILHFEVYRAPIPYFNPNHPSAEHLGEVPTNAEREYEYLDDNSGLGSVDHNSFYVVRTAYSWDQTSDANIVGEFDFSLSPGVP